MSSAPPSTSTGGDEPVAKRIKTSKAGVYTPEHDNRVVIYHCNILDEYDDLQTRMCVLPWRYLRMSAAAAMRIDGNPIFNKKFPQKTYDPKAGDEIENVGSFIDALSKATKEERPYEIRFDIDTLVSTDDPGFNSDLKEEIINYYAGHGDDDSDADDDDGRVSDQTTIPLEVLCAVMPHCHLYLASAKAARKPIVSMAGTVLASFHFD